MPAPTIDGRDRDTRDARTRTRTRQEEAKADYALASLDSRAGARKIGAINAIIYARLRALGPRRPKRRREGMSE
jgi:hypothetical protein